MFNVVLAFDGFCRLNELSLKPKFRRTGWPLKDGNHVWYINLEWLNIQVVIDNEQ